MSECRCTCTERQDKPCLIHPYDCAADKLTRAIERIQQLETLFSVAACPNACIGGAIPHGDPNRDFELEQCQFCYERDVLLPKETDNEP